jgi:hypothetical protein
MRAKFELETVRRPAPSSALPRVALERGPFLTRLLVSTVWAVRDLSGGVAAWRRSGCGPAAHLARPSVLGPLSLAPHLAALRPFPTRVPVEVLIPECGQREEERHDDGAN